MSTGEWILFGLAVALLWIEGCLTRRQMKRESEELAARLEEIQRAGQRREGGEIG